MVVSLHHSQALSQAASEEDAGNGPNSSRYVTDIILKYHRSPYESSRKYRGKGWHSSVCSSQRNKISFCCLEYDAALADFRCTRGQSSLLIQRREESSSGCVWQTVLAASQHRAMVVQSNDELSASIQAPETHMGLA